MIHLRTKSAEDTQTMAGVVAGLVVDRDLLLLSGDLGTGKTTFSKGFGNGLGVTEPITSPTFVLMHTYQGRMKMHHADVYRLEHLHEVLDLGLLEMLDEGGVALVEWGDKAAPALPRDFLEVRISVDEDDDDQRLFQLNGIGPQWSIREKAVADAVGQWVVASSAENDR